MAQYTQAQLISASNATYVTNTSGSITAADVRGLNDTWISSSALVSQSNTFSGNQIISGGLDVTGNFTASLQSGYVWVGNASGKSSAFATSSLVTNINTGSLVSTASFNAYTASTNQFTASINSFTASVNSKTGSYLTTGSTGVTQQAYGVYRINNSTSNGYATLSGDSIIVSGSGGQTVIQPNIYQQSYPTQGGFNFVGPSTFIQSTGTTFFQNQIGGVGSGSYNFTTYNGGNFQFTAQGGGNVNFNTNTGSLNATIANNINIAATNNVNIRSLSTSRVYFNGEAYIGNQDLDTFSSPSFVNNYNADKAFPGFINYVDTEKNPGAIYAFLSIDDHASGSDGSRNAGFANHTFSPYTNNLAMQIYGGGNGNGGDNTVIFAAEGQLYMTKNLQLTGSLDISDGFTFSAPLPNGYIWLGRSNGRAQAVSTGSISLQGVQGVAGQNGTQGPQGTTGTAGGAGQQGTQGAQGASGTNGTQGATGAQGAFGQGGTQGTTGAQGAAGSGGQAGTQGAQGATGAGTQGATGSQGATGTQGGQGATGQGTAGSQGTQGPSGGVGQAGTQGAQGATGSGTQGTTGAQGATGAQGSTGTGTQGAQGYTGAGSQGAAGGQGLQGPSGTSGQATQGPQGTAGSGFSSISPNTSGNILIANGSSNSATSDNNVTISSSTIYANAFYQNSSRRLKTNIEKWDNKATDLLDLVEVVKFNYLNDLENEHIGFIAEDTPIELSTKKQNTMDSNSAIGLLIKAVQELKAEIEELKGK